MNSHEIIKIDKALKRFGGFVRYYDTTEPLAQLAQLVSTSSYQNILACCAGGDQALTMLGASRGQVNLWAVDVNPAQLFVLAGKSFFLRQYNLMPSFKKLQQAYPERIAAVKKNIRSLQDMYLYHRITGKKILPPAGLVEKYKIVTDNEMFTLREPGPFWKEDLLFIKRVRARLGSLCFMQVDIFDSPHYFKQASLDLIYLSDIFLPEALGFYQEKLARMVALLRAGGRIISYLDPGDDFMGRGISPGRILVQRAKELNLKIDAMQANGYLVLERMRKR